MKPFVSAALIAAATMTAATLPAQSQAADVGVSISVGEPGFYGRIDIGHVPQPVLVYPEPVVVRPGPVAIGRPIYLHVPPGHAKHWDKHCARYNACNQRVYFVQEGWYNQVYVPEYRRAHNWGHGHDRNDRRDRREREGRNDRHDRNDDRRHNDQGKGWGQGR